MYNTFSTLTSKAVTTVLCLLFAATIADAIAGTKPYVMPPVSGVCTGNSGVGVGCGFDGSKVTAFSLTMAPKKSVLDIPWCEEKCYATCPPTYPIPYECEDCVYQDAKGRCFRNPYNIQSTATPTQGGCYESEMADNTASYDEITKKSTSSGSGGFFFHHTHSKTVEKVYQMFFEKNYSLALSYKYVLQHSVTLVPTPRKGPSPSREFRLAAELLPKSYDRDVYRRFLDTFGTHYMSQAYMGGSALLTNYFHSCFLHTFKEKDVSEASSSSFFGIFHDNKASGWGSIINKTMWDTWSEIDLKLDGGNASAYGTLGLNNVLGNLEVAAWQSTIDASSSVPLTYTLRPITEVLAGSWIDASVQKNVVQALADYDTEVGVEMKQLQESLVMKDHFKTPKWCKAPKPPNDEERARQQQQKQFRTIGTKDMFSVRRRLNDEVLPGCPALPPIPPLLSATRTRTLTPPSNRRLRGGSAKLVSIATAQNESQDGVAPIPGLLSASGDLGSLFGRGYDPVQGVPRASIAEWHYEGWECQATSDGTKSSCDAEAKAAVNLWVDPSSGLQFGKPDEIQIFDTPASDTEGGFKMFLDFKSYTKWHWSMHSTSIGLGFFDYSHFKADAHLTNLLKTKTATIAVKNRREISYQMTMWNSDVLKCEMNDNSKCNGTQENSSFAAQRAALPTTCDLNTAEAQEYSLFREMFGTHYVESAIYGGEVQFVIVINTTLYEKMSLSAIAEETAIGFDLIFAQFAMFHGHGSIQQDVSTEFRQHTQVVLLSTGGNSLYLEEQSFPKWSASVPSNPAPIDVTFRNITDLFTTGGQQQQCMTREVKTYLKRNHTPRYRCGNAAGTKVTQGIPKPRSRHVLGVLPTLEEAQRGLSLQQRQKRRAVIEETDDAQDESLEDAMATKMSELALSGNGTACDPEKVIPGASQNDLVGKTFDIKSGEPRLRAAQMTCANNKLWYSPFTKRMVQIPDQLDFVDTSSSCSREDMDTISDSTSAWKVAAKAWGFYVGLSLPIGLKIGVGFEKFMMNAKKLLQNFTKTSSSLRRDLGMYRLSFGASADAPPVLNPMLQMSLDHLPVIKGGYAKATAQQRGMYDTFIRAFGTHYVAAADFGAHCEFTTMLNKSYISTKTESYVQEQIGISIGLSMEGIGIALDLGYEEIRSAMKQDADFKKHAMSAASCSGGNLALLDQNPPQYDKWVESVYSAPNWINGSTILRPLSELIVGENAAAKRDCLREAVEQYLGSK
jgi:hypothetical protein